MKYNLKTLLNVLIIIALFISVITAIMNMINTGSSISLYLNINSILQACSFLIYLNKNAMLGMILANISFLAYVILVVVFVPDKLFQVNTLIRLIASIYITYQVYVMYRKWKVDCSK